MIRVISLWQPFASLLMHGSGAYTKTYETRAQKMPFEIGERVAIAATKQIKREQRELFEHPRLQRYLRETNLPTRLEDYPRGCIIGTAVAELSFVITPEMARDIHEREYVFGDWTPGRWAWLFKNRKLLDKPIPVRGGQGVWHYHGKL